MAMKPYSITDYQRSTYYDSNSGQSTFNMYQVGRKILNGIVTYSGGRDRSTPRPHAYSKLTERGFYGSIKSVNGSSYTERVGSMPYVFNWTTYNTGFNQSCRNLALAKLYEQLRGSVDVSIDLVQWRKTLQMVSLHRRLIDGIAKSAIRLIPKLDKVDNLKRDLTDARRLGKRTKRLARELEDALETVARLRLELVYGWRPTMGTIHELAKGVLLTKEPGLIKVEGTQTIRIDSNAVQTSIGAKAPIKFRIQNSSRCRIVCYYTPIPSVMDNLSKITSLNPVSILYEATPFSFVLDWAVDISSWLRTLESAFIHRNDFVKGYQSVSHRCSVEARCQVTDSTNSSIYTNYDLTGVGIATTFARTLVSSTPYPTGPVVKKSFGAERMLNALALAKVVLPRADKTIAGFRLPRGRY